MHFHQYPKYRLQYYIGSILLHTFIPLQTDFLIFIFQRNFALPQVISSQTVETCVRGQEKTSINSIIIHEKLAKEVSLIMKLIIQRHYIKPKNLICEVSFLPNIQKTLGRACTHQNYQQMHHDFMHLLDLLKFSSLLLRIPHMSFPVISEKVNFLETKRLITHCC